MELNFGHFMRDRGMVLCNNTDALFGGGADYEFESRPEHFSDIMELDREVYQYFITSLDYSDVAYYNKHYGLRFIYSESLDLWVFLNDICFGMSFDDVNLKYREGEAEG